MRSNFLENENAVHVFNRRIHPTGPIAREATAIESCDSEHGLREVNSLNAVTALAQRET